MKNLPLKKLLGATLALSLLGSSAALAAPYGHGDFGHRDFGHSYHRGGNDGALMAGVGLFALAAILATSQNHDQSYYDDYRAPLPPPPPAYGPPAYGPGYWGR